MKIRIIYPYMGESGKYLVKSKDFLYSKGKKSEEDRGNHAVSRTL